MLSPTQLCWRYISLPLRHRYNVVQWNSPASVFIGNTPDITKLNVFENYIFKRTSPSPSVNLVTPEYSGGWFNIKMMSYQYMNSRCGDKTIFWPSYLHNANSYTGKTISLYWIRFLVTNNNWTALYDQTLTSLKAPHSWPSQDCFGMPTLSIMMKTNHVMIGHATYMWTPSLTLISHSPYTIIWC